MKRSNLRTSMLAAAVALVLGAGTALAQDDTQTQTPAESQPATSQPAAQPEAAQPATPPVATAQPAAPVPANDQAQATPPPADTSTPSATAAQQQTTTATTATTTTTTPPADNAAPATRSLPEPAVERPVIAREPPPAMKERQSTATATAKSTPAPSSRKESIASARDAGAKAASAESAREKVAMDKPKDKPVTLDMPSDSRAIDQTVAQMASLTTFEGLDQNKDQLLEKEEVVGDPVLANFLADWDVDKDGKLSDEEYKAYRSANFLVGQAEKAEKKATKKR